MKLSLVLLFACFMVIALAGALVLHRELAADRPLPHGHDRDDSHPQFAP